MEKILIITPHLSTGGQPQYLFKKLQTFQGSAQYCVIEWDDITGGVLVVQKNKIKNLLGENLITLGADKNKVFDYIQQIGPDVIHFEELPETFIADNILDRIYENSRTYKITCTTHSSFTNPAELKYSADKFILVSEWSKNIFVEHFKGSVPCEVWEYPVEPVEYDKAEAKKRLDFDPEYKHVLNVGLFTPGKNQQHIVELAKRLRKYKIIFHFVGNQADNFKSYWEPIMADFPDNCIWHGERDDVNEFYKAADIFYFPSNFELNPLSIKEATAHGLPVFMKKLETCTPQNAHIISDNIEVNKSKLLDFFGSSVEHDVITLVVSHANNMYRKDLLKECLKSIKTPVILSSNYPVEIDEQELCDWVLYEKENALLYLEEYEIFSIFPHKWEITSTGERIVTPFNFVHTFACYQILKNGLRLVKSLGKSRVQVLNYDYLINETEQRDNFKKLNEFDFIFYESASHHIPYYWTGYFLGKTDLLLHFFEKYKTRQEYFKDTISLLFEEQVADFYKNYSNIYVKNIDELKKDNRVDTEGADLFSKSDKDKKQNNILVHSNYFEGPCIEIEADKDEMFDIQFMDKDSNRVLYTSKINGGMWSKLNSVYYRNVKAEIRRGSELIYTENFNLKDRRVLIILDSKSLGDTLAWFPYAEEFRKQHGCKVIVSTFLNSLFRDQYPELEFVEPGSRVENIYAKFRIGWYNKDKRADLDKNPRDFKRLSLQQTASDVLGLEYKEVRPLLNVTRVEKKKKVGIGIHTTAQAKYWNNPTGWQEVVDYLKSQGYDVVLYSRETDGYMGNYNPKGVIQFIGSLDEIIQDMSECEFFIGIGSGLSWLAWSLNVPVFLISGFSEEFAEMQDCVRIINKSVCNGCFNKYWFDPGDWNWCPDHKDTDRQFECSKSITGHVVIEKIKEFHKQIK
jgi:autotransporter strand-loop-strand O-heptosyltransferase